MELLNIKNYNETRFGTSIALGNFDGVHIGHQKLINRMIDIAKIKNLKPSILLFKNHTRSLVDGIGPSLITSEEQKNDLIYKLGVDVIYNMDFDERIMKLSPERFFAEILIKRLNVKSIVVGSNYRFGFNALGDANLLKKLGTKYGIYVEIFEPIFRDDEIVSSTRIREYLSNGNMEKAKLLLGRNYSIFGRVVPGKNIGNKLGFPTANIDRLTNYVIPKNGVYSAQIVVNNKRYLSATNVGYNLTFNENSIKIESHIIDFDENIYDRIVELIFIKYLREEIKFKSIELLKKQILEDVIKVKSI